MLNFSSLPRSSWYGRLLRIPLEAVPKGTVVRVLQGELRGAKWVVGSSVHGCWLGSFEGRKQALMACVIKASHVVYGVGANAGFYTLLAARRVGPSDQVHAFEPLPANLHDLHRHIALNGHRHVIVHEVAIAATDGAARFIVGPSTSVGALSTEGDITVETRSIDALVAEGLPPPDVIKMDIEGGELAALEGAKNTLEKHQPILFVSTHSEQLHKAVDELLRRAGYTITDLARAELGVDDEIIAHGRARPLLV